MRKLRSVGAAIISLLIAAGSNGSNFRGASQVYLPVAGKVANFRTDVIISNLSNDTVAVHMLLMQGPNTALAAPQRFPPLTLGPNEHREIVDFFPTALGLSSGLGQVVFNACAVLADCNGLDIGGFRNISVESRIYSVDPDGTTRGQDFPGLPFYTYITPANFTDLTSLDRSTMHRAFITGLRQTGAQGDRGTFRTNLGFTNASFFSTAVLTARLFQASGAEIGVNTVTLGPLGQMQPAMAALFPGVTGNGLWMTVEETGVIPTSDAPAVGCADGCPGFFAYASVLDNGTGDATTLESQFFTPPTFLDLRELPPFPTRLRRVARH